MADAQTGLRLHNAAGGPDTAPIFFSVDEDIDAETWKSLAVQWFRGINSVLGVNRTGIYGGARQLAWAITDDVIGHSTTPGYRWAWQTKAWSGGRRALHPRVRAPGPVERAGRKPGRGATPPARDREPAGAAERWAGAPDRGPTRAAPLARRLAAEVGPASRLQARTGS